MAAFAVIDSLADNPGSPPHYALLLRGVRKSRME
jgi:hypothetical protein